MMVKLAQLRRMWRLYVNFLILLESSWTRAKNLGELMISTSAG